MSLFGPGQAIGLSALIAGLLVVVAGSYARRNDRLHTRQGAEVLAGFAAVMGMVSMVAGAVWFVHAA
jgi:hypothetical protein